MDRVRLTFVMVSGILLAGCSGRPDFLTPPPTDPVNDLEGYVNPFVMGHNHADPALHNYSFHTKLLYNHRLGGDAQTTPGAHVVDVRGDWLFVGATAPNLGMDPLDPTGGVYIFDIKEPTKPNLVGSFRVPGSLAGDRSVEASDDARWIVYGTESQSCGNKINPYKPGLHLVDAKDKTRPVEVDYIPARGVHSVAVHRVGASNYVVALVGTSIMPQNIFRIDEEAGKFVPVGSVVVSHDVAIVNDELEGGKPYLYVANVADLRVYDFSDPAHLPTPSVWAHPTDDKYGSVYVHAVAVNFTEGHRIVALESEDWDNKPSPLWVLDMTDWKTPELLTTWVNPANAPADAGVTDAGSLGFSTHNPRFENGILYLAHYHAGVWILDMRNLTKSTTPELMGYYLPHDSGGYRPDAPLTSITEPRNPRCPGNVNGVPYVGVPGVIGVGGSMGGLRFDMVPFTMDVEAKNGTIYAADLHTGLNVIQWDPDAAPSPSQAHS